MPLVINEVVSDIRIGAARSESRSAAEPEGNLERDRAGRVLRELRREARRLTGRDEDDPQPEAAG